MDMNSLDPDSRMGVKVLSGYRIESRPPRRDPHMVPQPSPDLTVALAPKRLLGQHAGGQCAGPVIALGLEYTCTQYGLLL